MFKLYKNRGVSLIELMVAVGLGLVLVLSMLAYYSISQRNAVDHQRANQEQQKIRNMLNLLAKDLENTGGFECAEHDKIFENPKNGLRFPRDIISLGENLQNRQIMFVHPVLEEYRFKALGLFEINATNLDFSDYIPLRIDAGCGQDNHSPMLIGATLLEVIPITEMEPSAKDITAFVSLSSTQAMRSEDSDNIAGPYYEPNMKDASVLFFSNNSNDAQQKLELPFGENTVDIFLGFSPPGRSAYVPNQTMTSLNSGGWINPFSPDGTNYDLLVDKDPKKTSNPTILNTKLKSTSGAMYPLKSVTEVKDRYSDQDLIGRLRAIKFQFTFGAYNGNPQRHLTRVIRFKNMHLMKLGEEEIGKP